MTAGGLWRNHRGRRGVTQATTLLRMLRQAQLTQEPVEPPAIMAAGIAQHGARFNELRSRGFVIENKTERGSDGRVLFRYFLKFDHERDSAQ